MPDHGDHDAQKYSTASAPNSPIQNSAISRVTIRNGFHAALASLAGARARDPPLWAAVTRRRDATYVAPSGLICALTGLADTAGVSLTCR